MPEQNTNDAVQREQAVRQHASPGELIKTREWANLIVLRTDNQPFAAAVLFCFALIFGGWYAWRATTAPGLINIDRTEPANSQLVVNVNTADAAELMLLPEIGIRIANLIVEERLANGLFRDAQDFGVRIRGIGPKTLPKLVPYLEGWTNEPRAK